jgi:hypothetical protein
MMKLNTTIAALFACSISFLPAQDAPAKEAPAEEAAEEPKPEGPFEKRAFRVFDLVAGLPDIITSVKDEASLAAAKTKLDELSKKLEAEAAELAKTEVPSNEARKKLQAKMKMKEKTMEKKMQAAMMGMMQQDPALGEKMGQMFMGFAAKMQEIGPTMEKYFEPDEEKEEGE